MGPLHDYRLIGDLETGRTRVKWLADRLRFLWFLPAVTLLCAIAFAAGRYRSPPQIPCEYLVFVLLNIPHTPWKVASLWFISVNEAFCVHIRESFPRRTIPLDGWEVEFSVPSPKRLLPASHHCSRKICLSCLPPATLLGTFITKILT